MTIKSATPSGSQRSHACAEHDGRTVAAFPVPFRVWRDAREAQRAPWPLTLVAVDVLWLAERQRLYGVPVPVPRALALLWGISPAEAYRLTAPLRGPA